MNRCGQVHPHHRPFPPAARLAKMLIVSYQYLIGDNAAYMGDRTGANEQATPYSRTRCSCRL